MAGSPQPRSLDPKATLLAVAAAHLRLNGARRVRLVAVAQEAGMTHANVYRYFASRDEMLDAVAAQVLKPVETYLADMAGAPDPADDKLERMVFALARAYRELFEREPNTFGLYAAAVTEGRPLARRHLGHVRRVFGDAIEEGAAAGVFDVSDKDAALALVNDALHRFIHPASIIADAHRPRATIEQRLHISVGVILRVLRSGFV